MRRSRFLALAWVVALLTVAPLLAAPAPDPQPQVCPTPTAAPEAAGGPAQGVDPQDLLLPEPVPLSCPFNRHCTFFCPEYPGCPSPSCIGGICVYGAGRLPPSSESNASTPSSTTPAAHPNGG